ncbi:30S ribosomal protein S3 [Candidatus Woesearchaeota archaeon]|nr:30S ribosomal protein S3 [Candidatus Woesearchaeota archaeon]
MIERKFVAQRIKEFQIQEFIQQNLKSVGHSMTKMQKTPVGEKITIYASRPGLIVGRKGENIKQLTKTLKKKFNLENPQIEISEVENPMLDATMVVERIVDSLERFGTQRFKGIGHKMMSEVINAGALGIEIIISGKVPSARAKSWRFYSGYLKKCGDIALTGVRRAMGAAQLKSGTIGVKVSIMPPDIKLPDSIALREEKETVAEEKKKEIPEDKKEPKGKKSEKKKEIKEEPMEKEEGREDQGTAPEQ